MKVRLFALSIALSAAALSLGLGFAAVSSAPGQPWHQLNAGGFSDHGNTEVAALASFNGQLFAGTNHPSGAGGQLWHMTGNLSWTPVMTNGFGNTNTVGIPHLLAFNGEFYASTASRQTNTGDPTIGGEIWRSGDGLSWTRVVSQGFGDTTQGWVNRMVVFSNTLLAGTVSFTYTHGGEIWRSSTGNAGDWTRVVTNGFGFAGNQAVMDSSQVFNGYLYAGTASDSFTGGEVWRSPTGNAGSWTKVSAGGFGTPNNVIISSLAAFNGYLYAGTRGLAGTAGSQVWRCQLCDGTDWGKVVDNGFGNANTARINALQVFGDKLYFMAGNTHTGLEVWRTANGTNWEQVGSGGFGDPANHTVYYNNAVTVFANLLYLGTLNSSTGGQVWEYLSNQLFLPLVQK